MMTGGQQVEFQFSRGAQQKIDPKVLPTGLVRRCENMRYDRDGRLVNRYGVSLLGTAATAYPGRPISHGDRLLYCDYSHVHEYQSAGTTAQGDRCSALHVQRDVELVTLPGHVLRRPDLGVYSTRILVAWVDDNSGTDRPYAAVIDSGTGATVVAAASLATETPGDLRVVVDAANGDAAVLWTNSTNVRGVTIDLAAASPSFSSASSIVTDLDSSSGRMDVCADTAGTAVWYMVYTRDVAGTNTIAVRSLTPSTLAVLNSGNSGSGAYTHGPVAITGNSSEYVYAGQYDTTNGFRVGTWTPSITLWNALQTLDSNVTDDIKAVAAHRADSTTAGFVWQRSPSSSDPEGVIERRTIDNAAALGTQRTIYGYMLASKPWTDSLTGNTFVALRYQADDHLQDSVDLYMIPDLTADATYLEASVGRGRQPWVTNNRAAAPSSVALLAANTYAFAQWRNTVVEPTTGSGIEAVVASVVKVGDVTRCQPCSHGGATYLGGGIVQHYDGRRLSELGFCHLPHSAVGGASVATAQTTGGSIANGTYDYAMTWLWVDAQGVIHESAPCPRISVTHGSGSTNSVDFDVPTLYATRKHGDGDETPVYLAVYRTTVGGSILYLLTTVANDRTAASLTFTDTAADGSLDTGLVLYTESGEQNHLFPPPSRVLVSHQDRVCGVDDETGDVWLSMPSRQGYGVAYPATATIDRGSLVEDIASLGSMDGALYALGAEFVVTVLYGDGPDGTGAGGVIPLPSVRAIGCGCSDHRGTITTPQGLAWVATQDGTSAVRVLPRGGGSVQELSADAADDFDTYGASVLGVVHIPEQTQVRWLLDDGSSASALACWDYGAGAWYTYRLSGLGRLAAVCERGGAMVATRTASAAWVQEDPTVYQDATNNYQWVVETGDIRPAALQGLCRVHSVTLLGEMRDDETVLMEASYNSGADWNESETWTLVEATDANAGEPIQLQWSPPTLMPSEGVARYRIGADTEVGGGTEGIVLHGLSLDVSRLPGTVRLADAWMK